jgi:carbonic anhydrase
VTGLSIRIAGIVLVLLCLAGPPLWLVLRPQPPEPEPAAPRDGREAFEQLKLGNARFLAGKRTLSADTPRDRRQRERLMRPDRAGFPFAAVVCSGDSRLVPTLLFDQPLGALYSVQAPGPVLTAETRSALEHAVSDLKVPLIVFLGNTPSGAIDKIRTKLSQTSSASAGETLPAHLRPLEKYISDTYVAHQIPLPDKTLTLTEEIIRRQAHRLVKESLIVREAYQKNHLHIEAGIYDLAQGLVYYLEWDRPAR